MMELIYRAMSTHGDPTKLYRVEIMPGLIVGLQSGQKVERANPRGS